MKSERFRFRCAVVCALFMSRMAAVSAQTPLPKPLPEARRLELKQQWQVLDQQLKQSKPEGIADAAIYVKGLRWALDYEPAFTPADEKLLDQAVTRCRERLAALKAGRAPWKSRKGKLTLGYVSKIDDSVQPYGVIVPKNYDPEKPIRLDVVLHGSQRPTGLNELRFMSRFDEGDEENPDPPDVPYIELHPLGRVENCYRWAGETDVFEAIDDVCERFKIDEDRIVLRGMSMGASGTWHLGLKHPDKFVALGPYCGYVDTHQFSETPLPNFVKVGPLPEHQELGLHMLDSVDYAANAGVVPVVAAMGEKDIFFDAHVIMGQAMKKEGLELLNLISPGTGHVIDPKTHAEQMRRIADYVDKGLNRRPESIRFVTWTLKYNHCHWLNVYGLERHYQRAEISAKFVNNRLEIEEPKNITRFSIAQGQYGIPRPEFIRIGSVELPIPRKIKAPLALICLERHNKSWRIYNPFTEDHQNDKSPILQGPIDDAFTRPFLCVRGTGTPWNPAAHDYAMASLDRFAKEWRQYFRGDLPIKNDTDVSSDDASKNLILFGDPGSNPWIAKALANSSIGWSKEKITLGDQSYPASDHLPAFIMPSRLEKNDYRYVVINSGHTFRGEDLGKLNYLLYPRWGDWAVLKIDPKRMPDAPVTEEVIRAGFFNEEWKLP